MAAIRPSTSDRIKGAAGAILLQLVIGYALITGLAVDFPNTVDTGLKLFGVAPEPTPPPPEPIQPAPVPSEKREGAASPPNLTATPTEIVAPPPVIRIVIPPPVIAAPKAGIGSDPSAGAADVRGPGTGSGGIGDGTGSGGSGDGGGSGGRFTPPRQTGGRLYDSDFPDDAAETGLGGKVEVRYEISAAGRVTDCEIVESSGYPQLDAMTCRLIIERFRFAPSRDERGRAVPSVMIQNHYWDNRPGPERDDRRRRRR